MVHRVIVFALSLFVASVATPTSQIPEVIIVDGQRCELLTAPLESYLDENELRIESSSGSSALWRRYVGLWRIEGGTLSLVSLHDCDWDHPEGLGPRLSTDQVFPGQEPPFNATWFSGVLRIREGPEILYIHMGFDSIYSSERFILIENGRVVWEWTADRKTKECDRSTLDLVWATKAGFDVEDHLHWVDVRELVEEPINEQHVVTRGAVGYSDTDSKWFFGVPRSFRYPPAYLELKFAPAVRPPQDQSLVEIEGNLSIADDSAALVAKEISELSPGQTIHHPGYTDCDSQELTESE